MGLLLVAACENQEIPASGSVSQDQLSATPTATPSTTATPTPTPTPPSGGSSFSVIAYYPSWAPDNAGRHFMPYNIDFSIVTHVIHSANSRCNGGVGSVSSASPYFVPVLPGEDAETIGSSYVDPGTGTTVPSIQRGLIDEAHASGQKVLYGLTAVAGCSASNLSTILGNSTSMDVLVNAIDGYLRARGYDGLDINWEFPSTSDKANFSEFLRRLRVRFDAWTPHKGTLTLTIDQQPTDPNQYHTDPAAVNAYADYLLVESGARAYWGSGLTGNPSALYHPLDCPNFTMWTYADSTYAGGAFYVTVNGFAQAGVQKTKLSQLVDVYGHHLVNTDGPCQSLSGVWEELPEPPYGVVIGDYYQPSRFVRDEYSRATYLRWTEGSTKHMMGMEDAISIQDKIELLKIRGFSSITLFELSKAYLDPVDVPVCSGPRDYLVQAVGAAIRGAPLPNGGGPACGY